MAGQDQSVNYNRDLGGGFFQGLNDILGPRVERRQKLEDAMRNTRVESIYKMLESTPNLTPEEIDNYLTEIESLYPKEAKKEVKIVHDRVRGMLQRVMGGGQQGSQQTTQPSQAGASSQGTQQTQPGSQPAISPPPSAIDPMNMPAAPTEAPNHVMAPPPSASFIDPRVYGQTPIPGVMYSQNPIAQTPPPSANSGVASLYSKHAAGLANEQLIALIRATNRPPAAKTLLSAEENAALDARAQELGLLDESGMPDRTQLDAITIGDTLAKLRASKSGFNLQKVWVKRPGSESIEEAWANPRDPKQPLKLVSTGEDLPPGTVTVSQSIEAANIRSQMFGEFGNYYRAAKGQGMDDTAARKYAGDMVFEKYSVNLASREQDMAIKGELSGISVNPKSTLPPPPAAKTSGVSTVTTPIKPSATTTGAISNPPKEAADKTPSTNPSGNGIKATPIPSAKPSSPATPSTTLGFTDREYKDVTVYLNSLFGTLPASSGMASQVAIRNGLNALARKTGADPMTLSAGLAQDKATAKQLAETVQRTGAIQRLVNTLDIHGVIALNTIKSLHDTKSPLLNKPYREWSRALSGDPNYVRFMQALNAVQREYSYLTAGGAQSRAMLPVSVAEKADKLLSDSMTIDEAEAAIDQLNIESKAEIQAMNKTQRELIQSMRSGVAGRAVSNNQMRERKSKRDGHYEYSTDGGKTWQTGRMPR